MNERQRRFCECFASNGGNGAAAAREAGYSERSAREIARKLLTDVDILDYIRKLQDEAAATRIKSVIQVKAFWSEIMCDGEQKTKDRLRASELLAKSSGAFIDPHEETRFEGGEVQIYMPYTDRDEGCEIKREKM